MSFRKYGGLQFASKHNAVASYYNTSNNLIVTENVGQPNSYINFLSDISGNQIFGNVDVSGNLNVSGDIDCSGNITASEIFLIAPFHSYESNEVVPKSYVDTVGSGLIPYGRVKAISTYDSSGNIPGMYPVPIDPNNVTLPFYIDGVSIDVGDNVLLNDQGTNYGQDPSANNGVYTFNSLGGTSYQFQRSTTIFPSGADSKAAYITVAEGTVNSLSGWVQINDESPNTVGTTPLIFSNFFSFAFKLGQGLYPTQQDGQIYINVDSSLNFINYIDGSNNDTINIGTNTDTINIGKVSAGNNKMCIKTSVGINNNNPSPSYVLDVSGNTNVSGNGIFSGSVGVNGTSIATSGYLSINTGNTGNAINAPDTDTSKGNGLIITSAKSGSTTYSMGLGVDYATGNGFISCAGNSDFTSLLLNPRGSGGKVGIGTTDPQYTLDVSGNFQVTSGPSNTNPSVIITKNPGTYADFGTQNGWQHRAQLQIQSTNPDALPSAMVLAMSTDGSHNSVGIIQGTTNSAGYNNICLNPLNPFSYPHDARVGIGTFTPGHTLDVSGNINSSGDIYSGGTTGLYIGGYAGADCYIRAVTGTLSLGGGNIPVMTINSSTVYIGNLKMYTYGTDDSVINNNSSGSLRLWGNGNNGVTIDGSGNVYTANMNITGSSAQLTIKSSSDLSSFILANGINSNLSYGNFCITTSSVPANIPFVVTSGGNVAINYTNLQWSLLPAYSLQITGTNSNLLALQTNLPINGGSSSANIHFFTAQVNTDDTTIYPIQIGSISVTNLTGTPTSSTWVSDMSFNVNYNTHLVGMTLTGATDTTADLVVSGNIYANNSLILSNSGYSSVIYQTSSTFTLQNNNNDVITINAAGYVSIAYGAQVDALTVNNGTTCTGLLTANGGITTGAGTGITSVGVITANYGITVSGGSGIQLTGLINASDSIIAGTTITAGTGLTVTGGGASITGTTDYLGLTSNPMPAGLIIKTTTGTGRLLMGAYYTGGVGFATALQSSDYYTDDGASSPTDHFGSTLYLNPQGGNVNAINFVSTSDYRIKENVETLDSRYTTDNLRPVTYLNKKLGKQDIGLIAHELQEIYPELVNGVKDGEEMQSVNYIALIPILIKEIQELKKEIKSVKIELNELKNK